MRRKGPKRLLELRENISFVHLNVRSGYISYIEVPSEGSKPRVRGILFQGKNLRPDAH